MRVLTYRLISETMVLSVKQYSGLTKQGVYTMNTFTLKNLIDDIYYLEHCLNRESDPDHLKAFYCKESALEYIQENNLSVNLNITASVFQKVGVQQFAKLFFNGHYAFIFAGLKPTQINDLRQTITKLLEQTGYFDTEKSNNIDLGEALYQKTKHMQGA